MALCPAPPAAWLADYYVFGFVAGSLAAAASLLLRKPRTASSCEWLLLLLLLAGQSQAPKAAAPEACPQGSDAVPGGTLPLEDWLLISATPSPRGPTAPPPFGVALLHGRVSSAVGSAWVSAQRRARRFLAGSISTSTAVR